MRSNPNPSAPSTAPECIRQFLPTRTFASNTALGSMIVPSATLHPSPMKTFAPMYDSGEIFASGETTAEGCMPLGWGFEAENSANNSGSNALGFWDMSPILEGVKNSSGAAMGIFGAKASRAFLSQITHSELESAFSGEDIRVISCSGLPENFMLSFSAISDNFMIIPPFSL